jgi:hypothetical protein
MTLGLQGRLFTREGDQRQVTRREPEGRYAPLAQRWGFIRRPETPANDAWGGPADDAAHARTPAFAMRMKTPGSRTSGAARDGICERRFCRF